ncbi:TorA maturation chaperone TorD [Streptomyces sp. SAI-170]|uniref:hypothetical protein n=1 Tax=Streptomyces sp. SAI-170 TaxID=3377729 RepID=UPI003C7B8A3A
MARSSGTTTAAVRPAPRREHPEKAKTEPATEAQVKYLTTLAETLGKERLDAEFAKVIKGSATSPRAPWQLRDGREAADQSQGRKLITALAGHDWSA